MNGPLLKVDAVSHRYGELIALDDVNLQVERGEVVGLVGRNGAGKTTLIRLVSQLIPLQSGTISIDAGAIGYVPQRLVIWPDLTVLEQLEFMAAMHEVDGSNAAAAAERMGLADKLDALGSELSGGMQRRLSIAMAMLHRPRVLILDEPHVGLDPGHRARLRELLVDLADDGIGIVLSSHELPELERAADRVVVLESGRIVDEGTPAELMRQGNLEARFS